MILWIRSRQAHGADRTETDPILSLLTWLRNLAHRTSMYLQHGDSPTFHIHLAHNKPSKHSLITVIITTTVLLLLLFVSKERQRSTINSALGFLCLECHFLQIFNDVLQILASIWPTIVLFIFLPLFVLLLIIQFSCIFLIARIAIWNYPVNLFSILSHLHVHLFHL